MVQAWRKLPYDDEIRQRAREAGLILRDMPAEVMDDPSAGREELWKPFPYPGWTPPKASAPAAAAAPAPTAPATPAPAAGGTSTDHAKAVAGKAARAAARRGKGALKGAIQGWRNSSSK